MRAYALIKIAKEKNDNGMSAAEKAAIATALVGGTVAGGTTLGAKGMSKLMKSLSERDLAKARGLDPKGFLENVKAVVGKDKNAEARKALFKSQAGKSAKAAKLAEFANSDKARRIAYGGGALAAAGGVGAGYEEYQRRK